MTMLPCHAAWHSVSASDVHAHAESVSTDFCSSQSWMQCMSCMQSAHHLHFLLQLCTCCNDTLSGFGVTAQHQLVCLNLCCVPLQARLTCLWAGKVYMPLRHCQSVFCKGQQLEADGMRSVQNWWHCEVAGLICKGMKVEVLDPASRLLSKALVLHQLLLACSVFALFEHMSNNISLAYSGQRALSVTTPE